MDRLITMNFLMEVPSVLKMFALRSCHISSASIESHR